MRRAARTVQLPGWAAIVFTPAPVAAHTTVTKYTYNADGALTSIAVTPDDAQPTTTYLVWDNFTPDTADPTTGTTAVANGRLVGFGPSPDNLTTTFHFDVRDDATNGGADGDHAGGNGDGCACYPCPDGDDGRGTVRRGRRLSDPDGRRRQWVDPPATVVRPHCPAAAWRLCARSFLQSRLVRRYQMVD
jgi:YD repeat-containing protein